MPRGRKPKENYFGRVQEEAVIKFLKTECESERNKIYNETLKEPLIKMVESIIRRYKLYRKNVSFEDLHSDTLSFLISKANNFSEKKGSKAYSYYGTICKNYLLCLLIGDDKETKNLLHYDDMSESINEDMSYSYSLDGDIEVIKESYPKRLINNVKIEIKKDLVKYENHKNKLMTENEYKVGLALMDILDDWERLVEFITSGNKYNKVSLISAMEDLTGLSAKEIRLCLKRYKERYFSTKKRFLKDF